MDRQKYITFILLLCFTVIPAHSMIPHHHHDGMYAPLHGNECPAEHHDHNGDHQEKYPMHCHAFNEISFYKHIIPGLSDPSEQPVLYADISTDKVSNDHLNIYSELVDHPSAFYRSVLFVDLPYLRGPPAVV